MHRVITVLSWVLATHLPAAAAAAQGEARFDGDYALAVDGTVIMTVHLTQTAGGTLGGSVSAGGKTLPVTGTVQGAAATFITTSTDGGFLHWQAQPTGDGLAVSIAPSTADGRPDAALAQQHVLTRRTGNSISSINQAAQQWILRLSAVADSITVWCASPSYRQTDVCVKAMQILHRVAPALMVARLTTSGQAASLLRVLASGPGASSAGAPGATPASGDMFAALQPPPTPSDANPPSAAAASPAASANPSATQPTSSTSTPSSPRPTPGGASSRTGTSTLGRALLGGAGSAVPSASSMYTGEWGLYEQGSEVAVLHFEDAAAGGATTGTISILGESPLPFSGAMTGKSLDISYTTADGTPIQWRVTPQGDRLAVSLLSSGGGEQGFLERRTGWSESSALALHWRRMLEGHAITRTTRTSGGQAGGATTDFTMSFCSGGVLAMQSRTTVSVAVPGASGGETSRQAGRGAWRVVERRGVAAVVTSSDEGTLQLGLREGTAGTLYLGQELVRLGPASCS